MTAKWEKTDTNTGELTVNVAVEKVDDALDQAFKKVVKDVDIPGFRKGKVPRGLFEQRFGVEALYEDAANIVVPNAYTEAIDEVGIEPVDQPELNIEQIEKGKELIFTAKVTVKPEVELGQYKGLEVVEQDKTVTDEDIDEEITKEQEKLAELVVKEEGQVENGDTVVIDFEGFIDGEAFEGGKAENHSLEIGSQSFIPGFEEQLIGIESGAETSVTVNFPDDYQVEELKGKEAVFEVKVHEIKQKEIPERDDEFAKDADENVETLAELKDNIRQRLEDEKQQNAENTERDEVVEKASENATIEIPDPMVSNELDRMMQEFEQRLQSQGLSKDMYLQFSGMDENGLREQMQGDAEKRLRANLTLEAIGAAESVAVTDEAVDEELQNMAEMYGQSAEQIKTLLEAQGVGTDAVKSDLRVRNTINFLLEQAQYVSQPENNEPEADSQEADAEEDSAAEDNQ